MSRFRPTFPLLTCAMLLLVLLLSSVITVAGELPEPTEPDSTIVQLPDPAGDPILSTEPIEPDAPADPEGPAMPVEPTEPMEPVAPTEPTEPMEPIAPAKPETPAEPDAPTEPTVPSESEPPARPETPAEPDAPAQPVDPADPAEPETPAADPDASVGAGAAADTPEAAPVTEVTAIDPAAEPDASADEDASVLTSQKIPAGWQEIGGKWYYYNKDGSVVTGSFEVNGSWYYADSSGARQTGLINAPGLGTLYAGADGALGKGWHDTTYGSYYFGDNYIAVTGWQDVEGVSRWFDPASALAKQGIVQDSDDYYFYSRGVAAEHLGFWYEGGYNYYFGNPGAAAYKGVFNIGSDYFFAFPDATVRSGLMWDYDADGLRYGDVNTLFLAQKEWVSVADKGSYYFDGNALALGGDQVVGGVDCYFDPETFVGADGILQREDGGYYYYNQGQNNAYGFVYTGGYNYYFGAPGGPAYTGLFTVGGEAFYAFPDGTIRSGLLYYDEEENYVYGDPGTLWLARNKWVTPGDGNRYYFNNLYLLAAQEAEPEPQPEPEAPDDGGKKPRPEPAAPENVSGSYEAYAREVHRLVNAERAKAGLDSLAYLPSLSGLAMVRAEESAALFEHTRPDGRGCFSVYNDANYSYSAAGENLARGYNTPEAVMAAWMASEGHRENILRSTFTQIGVAVCEKDGRIYCTQLFTKNFKWMG